MERRRVTLKDLAAATGVHVSTVSRALNPDLAGSLTTDVVERVRKAAETLGYRPNHSAFSLRTRRTMTVGVLIPDITNTIFPPIVRGIESVLEPLGYASLLVNTDNQPARERSLLGQLVARGDDGHVHAGIAPEIEAGLDRLLEGRPLVAVNRRPGTAEMPCVVNDDEGGIRKVFQHLAGLGHERIAHLAGPRNLSTGAARRDAFERQCHRAGLAGQAAAVFEAAAYVEAEGERCAHAALDADPGCTALLCANDRLALGALRAVAARGLACPADVSVTGFNDMPLLDLIPPGLSTVRIPLFESGEAAGRLLAIMMREPGAVVPTQTVMPVDLVMRGSVAPPGPRTGGAAGAGAAVLLPG